MGAVGFGKEFNNLGTGIEHPAIKGVHDHMGILGVLGHVPWFLNLASRIPGAASGYSSFFKWCGDEIERKQKVCKEHGQFSFNRDADLFRIGARMKHPRMLFPGS